MNERHGDDGKTGSCMVPKHRVIRKDPTNKERVDMGQMSVQLANDGARRFRPRHFLRARSLRVWLVVAVSVATVSILGATAPVSSKVASAAGAPSACAPDGAAGCLVTLPCPTGQTICPTVDVAPNTNLTDGQFVYVTAKNMPAGDILRVAFCSAAVATDDPACLNGNWETRDLIPTTLPVIDNAATGNETSVAYPTYLNPAGEGNNPIPAHDLTNTIGVVPGFYCDGGTHPCNIVVTDQPASANGAQVPITDANSAVVPLHYGALADGCPSSDTVLQVSSTYSLEHFVPAAVEATCKGKTGVVALNTANDATSVLNDFASGSSIVSFVDNMADPSQIATLLGKGYALVPVALSGTEESILAGFTYKGTTFPLNSYKMTPNMLAGLITSLYQQPRGTTTPPPKPTFALSDNLVAAMAAASPPVTCAQQFGCPAKKTKTKQVAYQVRYNAFDMLNPGATGDIAPAVFGSFNANVASASSFEATSWLCSAPNTPFQVNVDLNATDGSTNPVPSTVTVTDTNKAPSTLTTAPLGSSIWPPYAGAPWVYPDCHGYSTFPALSATANNYSPAQSPAFQAKAMRSWCYGGGVLPQPPTPQDPCASFGLMDTSEAQFYGLSPASLQNASGNFVAPTIAALQAAANDMTPCPTGDITCPSGTYQVDYANTDSAAYVMPNITYAVVPTGTLPYETATAVTNLLNNMVNFSHSGALPAGYAPLPDGITQAALADIKSAVHSAPAPPATTTTTTTAPASTTSSSSTDSGTTSDTSNTSTYDTSGSNTAVDTGVLPYTPTDGATPGPSSPGSGPGPVPAPPSTIPKSFLVVLAASTRYLLPAIVLVGLASAIGGALLLFGPGAAARRKRSDGGLA